MDITTNQIIAGLAIVGSLLFMLRDKFKIPALKKLIPSFKPSKEADEPKNQDCVLKNLLDFRSKFEKGSVVYDKLTEAIEIMLKEEPIMMSQQPTIDTEEIEKIIEGLNELIKGQ